jgi:hypothetical protein
MSLLLLDPAQREESQTHEFIAISSILSRVVVQSLAIMDEDPSCLPDFNLRARSESRWRRNSWRKSVKLVIIGHGVAPLGFVSLSSPALDRLHSSWQSRAKI